MTDTKIFTKTQAELHQQLYEQILGPKPTGVILTIDGWPSWPTCAPVASNREWRNQAADIWQTLHDTDTELLHTADLFLREQVPLTDLRHAVDQHILHSWDSVSKKTSTSQ